MHKTSMKLPFVQLLRLADRDVKTTIMNTLFRKRRNGEECNSNVHQVKWS